MAKLVKDRRLNGKLDYLVEQIPREYWDLRLLHPRITWQRFAPSADLSPEKQTTSLSDRSGAWVTVEDLLVRLGILVDDSDLFNNGEWTFKPTLTSNEHRTVIVLETNDNAG